MSATAQDWNDSIATHDLKEVIVKASRRIQKGDTLTVIPSINQQKFNVSGFELIQSMMLPGLKVNTITGELNLTDGGNAIVLINGRPVDRQDIIAIRPKDVAKVEYVQNSGIEYGYDESIGAIINFIMKKRADGYAAAVFANNAISTANGQNFVFGKYTTDNSEYAISLNSDYTSLTKRRVDNNNTYMLGDKPHSISFKGVDTPLKFSENTLQAGYNHYLPEKHIFDITFKGVFYYSPDRAYLQEVTEDDRLPYFQHTEPYEKYLSPRLNIYYKRFLNEHSTLTANIAGNYRHTDYKYTLSEFNDEDLDIVSNTYKYGTKSKRQSYIGEVKYFSQVNRTFNLSIGSRVAYSYTANKYISDNSSTDKMHDTNLYAYASSSGYLGKVYYLAGVGLSGRIINQNGESSTKWILHPQIQFIYNMNGWKFNILGRILQNSPSLSEMATTEFRINRFELKKGNPNLKNWWKYRTTLRITKNIGPLNIQNSISYNNSINPVMSYILPKHTQDGTLFVTSFDNQKRMSILTNSLNLEFGPNDNLALSMSLDFNSYQSRGSTYTKNLNNWQINVGADWFTGNWNAGINLHSRNRSLNGEYISYTGPSNTIYINYIVGNQWRFGLMGQYLFSKNGPVFKENIQNKYLSKHESIVVPAQRNMIMVTVAWNFSSGKQRKSVNIDMNNEDNDSGIFK